MFVEVGIERVAACELLIEGGVSEINWEVAIADVDECGSNTHDELKGLADVEGCACVYALFSPMQCGSVGSIFCSHLVFLRMKSHINKW